MGSDSELLFYRDFDDNIAPPLSDFITVASVDYYGNDHRETEKDLLEQLKKYFAKSKLFSGELRTESNRFLEFLHKCNDIATVNLASIRLQICEYAPAARVTLYSDVIYFDLRYIASFEYICKNSKFICFIPHSQECPKSELTIDFNFNCK